MSQENRFFSHTVRGGENKGFDNFLDRSEGMKCALKRSHRKKKPRCSSGEGRDDFLKKKTYLMVGPRAGQGKLAYCPEKLFLRRSHETAEKKIFIS